MKIDLINLALTAIVFYIGYYIYTQNDLIKDQEQIMDDQFNLIETQRAYILEINKMLGINSQFYFYTPQNEQENPINDPI